MGIGPKTPTFPGYVYNLDPSTGICSVLKKAFPAILGEGGNLDLSTGICSTPKDSTGFHQMGIGPKAPAFPAIPGDVYNLDRSMGICSVL